MSVARSTTVERLRSRRKQAGTASVPTPVPQHTRKLAELWSDAAAKMAPSDVDAAWARLLEETLPPEKREPLHRSYVAETDPSMRYNMLLEFSSYLRQVPTLSTPCNAALAASARPLTAQLLPLQGAAHEAGGGGYDGAGREDDGISLTWEIGRVVFIVVAVRRRRRRRHRRRRRNASVLHALLRR